jgi:RNA polymerase sigma-70 factor, ECF subfamily
MKLSNKENDRAIFEAGQPGSERNGPDRKPSSIPGNRAGPSDQIEREIIELMNQHTPSLSRYGARATPDLLTIQDGIQEAFFRYFNARVGGQKVKNPRAWLFKVLRNYLLDCKRKENSMSAIDLEQAGQMMDSTQDLESGYQKHECFCLALSSLSIRERECMQLRLEGFGYQEIAGILKIHSGTVAALLARALKKIQGSFTPRATNE